MQGSDWRRIEELFHQATELSPTARGEFLQGIEDAALRGEVESLLAADEVAEGLVDGAVAESVEWLAEASPEGLPDLGPYRPLRELGRGGFGTVYLAERTDHEFRLEVAVKRLQRDFGPSDLAQRFLLERQILAQLDHPNIAKLFDAGTSDGGDPYFVMEYIDGSPIDGHCDTHRLTTRQRLELMLDVCAAVSYAHRNLVVHRDLKPSNIMVTADGVPKLLDFGIAKLLDEGSGSPLSMTQTGLLPLTPEYASPEQVRGEALKTTTDVYSLGVLLYRLLSGRAPYVFPTPRRASVIERIICEDPVPTMSEGLLDRSDEATMLAERRGTSREGLGRELAGDLDNIVAKALRKEGERRYGSVERLADDLRRHLDRRPVSATGDSLVYVTGRFLRRHAWAVSTVVLLLLSLLGGIVATTYQMRQAKRHQARAERVIDLLVNDVFGSATKDRAQEELPNAREILDQSSRALDRQLVSTPYVHGTVLTVVGGLYEKLGAYDQAQVFLQRGLDRLRPLLGSTHPEVLHLDGELANVLLDRELFLPARELLEETVRHQRREPRSAEDLTLSLLRLAIVEHRLGNPEKAQSLIAESLQLRQRLHGEDSLQVADAQAIQAQFARQARDSAGAEEIFEKVLEVRIRLLGEDHRDVLTTLSDLAVCAYDQQDFARAEEILLRVVTLSERLYGPVHRDVANPLINLGAVQRKLGHYDAAVPVLERALEVQRQIFGVDHANTLVAARNLARLYLDQRKFEAAEALMRSSLESLRRQNADPLEIAKNQLDLADLETERGAYDRAIPLYREVDATLRSRLPEGHPNRALPLYQLGRIYGQQKDWERAEEHLRRALEIQRVALKENHYRTARTRAELALVWLAQGRFDEGRPLLIEGLERLEAELADNDPILRWVRTHGAPYL